MRKKLREKVAKIIKIMKREVKEAPVFKLEEAMEDPFRTLVGALISTRTKDEKTAEAVKRLFAIAKTPDELAKLSTKEIEKAIYGVGFYRTKAKNLKVTADIINEKFGGAVPDKIEELMELPGVGRKVANIVLATAYQKNALGVDTHVHRISNRLGIVKTKNPHETEKELLRIVPPRYVKELNRIFVAYGQTVCRPVSPFCSICKIRKYCKRINVKKSR
jgi:endonuclease-3